MLRCYGPTEATVWATYMEYSSAGQAVVLGTPFRNVVLHVVDDDLRCIERGEGQLALSVLPWHPDILASGDWKSGRIDSQLTSKAFATVETEIGSCRVYLTGDVVRRSPLDHTIQFVGRKNFQVKLNGFRIELGEIEAALRANELVSEAVVVMRESTSGRSKFVAAYVKFVNPALQLTKSMQSEIAAGLSLELPAYMVPRVFEALESFPVSVNHKVDRKALAQRR
jgi:acyl-coenzyme A synthetase/AMP-(fatty) acid ligase